jgi:hypothetical protein
MRPDGTCPRSPYAPNTRGYIWLSEAHIRISVLRGGKQFDGLNVSLSTLYGRYFLMDLTLCFSPIIPDPEFAFKVQDKLQADSISMIYGANPSLGRMAARFVTIILRGTAARLASRYSRLTNIAFPWNCVCCSLFCFLSFAIVFFLHFLKLRVLSSGTCRRIIWHKLADVSEESTVSIFNVED